MKQKKETKGDTEGAPITETTNEEKTQSTTVEGSEDIKPEEESKEEFKADNKDNAAKKSIDDVIAKSAKAAAASRKKRESKAYRLMEKYHVSELYENSKGEFFTSFDLACHSENGNKNKVITHKNN